MHCDACKVTTKKALAKLTDPSTGASSRVCPACAKAAPAHLKRQAARTIGSEDETPPPALVPPAAAPPAEEDAVELELGALELEGDPEDDEDDENDEEVSP